MPKKDAAQNALSIVEQVIGAPLSPSSLDNAAIRRQIMQEMGRRGGSKGGKARAKALTKSQRSQIAQKAASARWKNKK